MSNVCALAATAWNISLHFDRRHAVVLVHDADLKILDLSAEGVAEHDQLHQRHDDRNDHQRRAAPEPAQIAFDDGPDAVHIVFILAACMNGLLAAAGACNVSRN